MYDENHDFVAELVIPRYALHFTPILYNFNVLLYTINLNLILNIFNL
jgi:hypothetical protein